MASALPAAAASYDAAVVSFVLCTVPDQDAALAEIRRVLRPGGTLCFLEHVRADTAGLARMQPVLESTAVARRPERRSTARNPRVMIVTPPALSEFASRPSLASIQTDSLK
jgi:ubiquinone/menaquinone biosynthesis C-methylase UbiE